MIVLVSEFLVRVMVRIELFLGPVQVLRLTEAIHVLLFCRLYCVVGNL